MSNVAKALQNLYRRGNVNKTGLKRAVADGVSTTYGWPFTES